MLADKEHSLSTILASKFELRKISEITQFFYKIRSSCACAHFEGMIIENLHDVFLFVDKEDA